MHPIHPSLDFLMCIDLFCECNHSTDSLSFADISITLFGPFSVAFFMLLSPPQQNNPASIKSAPKTVDSSTTNNTKLGEILEKLEPIDSESLKKCNLENRWGRNWTPWTTNKLFTGDSDIYWLNQKWEYFNRPSWLFLELLLLQNACHCKNIADGFCTGRYPGCYCPEVTLYPLDHPFDCSRSIPANNVLNIVIFLSSWRSFC